MRKPLVPAAAAIVPVTSAVAFAAVQHTDRTIKTFDAKAMSLTLNDGTSFVLTKKFKDPILKTGERVSVMWDMSGANKVAESVKIAKWLLSTQKAESFFNTQRPCTDKWGF